MNSPLLKSYGSIFTVKPNSTILFSPIAKLSLWFVKTALTN